MRFRGDGSDLIRRGGLLEDEPALSSHDGRDVRIQSLGGATSLKYWTGMRQERIRQLHAKAPFPLV